MKEGLEPVPRLSSLALEAVEKPPKMVKSMCLCIYDNDLGVCMRVKYLWTRLSRRGKREKNFCACVKRTAVMRFLKFYFLHNKKKRFCDIDFSVPTERGK